MRAHRFVLGLSLTLVLATAGCTPPPGGGSSAVRSSPSAAAPSGDVVTPALRDVERFWAAAYPALSGGAAFRPVQGGFHPYTRADPPPACGDQPGEYQPNAFYCPAGDFIAWDAEELIPQLQQDFGPLLVGVVVAHEYGHAVQTRLGAGGQPTVVLEQQADCFAGAWVADVQAGHSTGFPRPSDAALDDTVAGLLLLRDQPGTSARSQQAHGNAFDRIRALQDGVEKGAATCAGYRAGTLPVTEVPFTSSQDAAGGGDLPYADAVNDLTADLQDYWSRTYPDLAGAPWRPLDVRPFTGTPPACADPDASAGGSAFYCPAGDFAAFDNARLGPALHQRIGDNAVGTLLGGLFARAAQDRRGTATSGRAGQLAVDCLAGSWTGDLLTARPGEQLSLSPGDLDEAVAALLAFGRAGEQAGTSAFDRIAAYRDGVLRGLPACR